MTGGAKNKNGARPGPALVISVMGIGNALLGLPLISALSRQKGEKVALAAWPPVTLRLLAGHPAVGRMVPVESNSVAGLFKAAPECRKLKAAAAYDLFPPSDRGHLLAFLSGAPLRQGFNKAGGQNWMLTGRVEVNPGLHDTEQNLRLAGLEPDPDDRARLYLTPAELKQAALKSPGGEAVGLHIGSGGTLTGRRWPSAHFAKLMDGLHLAGHRDLVMFGGPGQEPLMEQCQSLCQSARPRMEASPDIRQAAARAGRCRLMVSNDAVWLHIAAALDVPTLGIYGPTNPQRTAPPGPRHRVVRSSLACAPCYNYERWASCPHPGLKCLEGISPEAVLAQALEMLKDKRPQEPGPEEPLLTGPLANDF